MKYLFLYLSLCLLSVNVASSRPINDEKATTAEQEGKESKQLKVTTLRPAPQVTEAATVDFIGELTERAYLERKKRWAADHPEKPSL